MRFVATIERMLKSPQLNCCCCFVNNIRYVVLILLIACLSILFANIILYSIAVIYDDYQNTQLWRQAHLTELTSTGKRRFLRSVVNNHSLESSNIKSKHLTEILKAVNFNFNETVESYESDFLTISAHKTSVELPNASTATFAHGNLFSDTNVNEEKQRHLGEIIIYLHGKIIRN
ncbi:hypothetical protein WUBG_13252 [Wuchereria bancrofti]|uniref:Uncharacterized protein n=1 Tax=Wuchereria bancrofti TaxID=6293 RepID=J9EFM9_WUCBA|nr:hypothetical protein WUBG_13252 [Wuchereria bancrofti]